MGVDLRLYPIYLDGGLAPFPTNALDLDRERELWSHIEESLTERPLDGEMYHLDEEKGLVRRSDNPYGSPITWAPAGEIATLLREWIDRPDRQWPSGPWTRAAAAYLAQLSLEVRVVLWWH